jgi:hypothetical protein
MWRWSVVIASICRSAEVEAIGTSPASYCPLEDAIDFYENALAYTDPFFRETSLPWIRAHLPTLLLGFGKSVIVVSAFFSKSTSMTMYDVRCCPLSQSPFWGI